MVQAVMRQEAEVVLAKSQDWAGSVHFVTGSTRTEDSRRARINTDTGTARRALHLNTLSVSVPFVISDNTAYHTLQWHRLSFHHPDSPCPPCAYGAASSMMSPCVQWQSLDQLMSNASMANSTLLHFLPDGHCHEACCRPKKCSHSHC